MQHARPNQCACDCPATNETHRATNTNQHTKEQTGEEQKNERTHEPTHAGPLRSSTLLRETAVGMVSGAAVSGSTVNSK
jgi:hypothetical protein